MIDANSLSTEILRSLITKLPPGRARHKYEKLLCEKISVPLWGVQCEETPAPYFLDEILGLRDRTSEEIREIHKAKLQFPWARIIQEGPES